MSDFLNIYVIGFKPTPYELPSDDVYHPIEAGAALHNYEKDLGYIKDNTGDNISTWNRIYAEETGLYWVWKNRPKSKYIGMCQYRRQLIVSEDEIRKAFEEKGLKCVTCTPLKLKTCPYNQFSRIHGEIYLKQLEVIIKAYYPEISNAFNKYLKESKYFIYSNSYIMASNDFDEYCSFYFDVAQKFLSINGCKTPEDVEKMVKKNVELGFQPTWLANKRGYNYDAQLLGFIGERLWTVWSQWKFGLNFIGTKKFTLKENLKY